MIHGLLAAIDAHNLHRAKLGFTHPDDYGSQIIGGQLAFNGTASLAKWRLQHVIAADREAVPAYRWVRQPSFRELFFAMACHFTHFVMPPNDKPHYRWERRR